VIEFISIVVLTFALALVVLGAVTMWLAVSYTHLTLPTKA